MNSADIANIRTIAYDNNNLYVGGVNDASTTGPSFAVINVNNLDSITSQDYVVGTQVWGILPISNGTDTYIYIAGDDSSYYLNGTFTSLQTSVPYVTNSIEYDVGTNLIYFTNMGNTYYCKNPGRTFGGLSGTKVIAITAFDPNPSSITTFSGFNCPQAIKNVGNGKFYVLDGSNPDCRSLTVSRGIIKGIQTPFSSFSGAFGN